MFKMTFNDLSRASPQELAQLTNEAHASAMKGLFKTPIPIEKVFSRMCALQPNAYDNDIDKVKTEFRRIYEQDIKFKLIPYEHHDPESHFYSTRICYKLLQTGFRCDSEYKNPKTNTLILCPFCDFKPQNRDKKHKPHRVIIKIGKDQTEKVDSKVEGFYDTGQSGLAHHLAECHGVLKKSLMPQPFIGFSKSLSKDKNVYELSLVCPHQHWNEQGQLVGCNSIFPYKTGKSSEDDIPFKAFFRHFYTFHVSEPKDEKLLNQAQIIAQRSALAKKVDKLSKKPKHDQTPDNAFLPLNANAHLETINYQLKNTKEQNWHPTLNSADNELTQWIDRHCVTGKERYQPPTEKDEPLLSHNAINRPRESSPTSSSGRSSSKNSSIKISTAGTSPLSTGSSISGTSKNQHAQGRTKAAQKQIDNAKVGKLMHTGLKKNVIPEAALRSNLTVFDVISQGCVNPSAIQQPNGQSYSQNQAFQNLDDIQEQQTANYAGISISSDDFSMMDRAIANGESDENLNLVNNAVTPVGVSSGTDSASVNDSNLNTHDAGAGSSSDMTDGTNADASGDDDVVSVDSRDKDPSPDDSNGDDSGVGGYNADNYGAASSSDGSSSDKDSNSSGSSTDSSSDEDSISDDSSDEEIHAEGETTDATTVDSFNETNNDELDEEDIHMCLVFLDWIDKFNAEEARRKEEARAIEAARANNIEYIIID